MQKFKEILEPYNPWWDDARAETLEKYALPFRRPLFKTLREDIGKIPQILSITGPRRIGKSTLLYQLIDTLLQEDTPAERILYYSFDDPALMRRGFKGGEFLETIITEHGKPKTGTPLYLFLDEIQRLERWELYLKKYYDLKFNVRFIISGSASSPIFKKSRESLLGRVKDYHLLPFSFREFLIFHIRENSALAQEMEALHAQGKKFQCMLTGDPAMDGEQAVQLASPTAGLQKVMDEMLNRYFLEGGFPEVWSLPDWVAKQDYLYDNQIKKVIYEDLVLAAEFRKPELLKRFYISLLETPGREVSVQGLASESQTTAIQIDKYLPMLEMTDLVYRLEKFRKSPLRVRRGKMKFYLVDLALRNAILRLTHSLLQDKAMLGLYAENLVFLALKKWRGSIQMDYYRENNQEVDFIVHTGSRVYVPVEVKYRAAIDARDTDSIRRFSAKYAPQGVSLLVTKSWGQMGKKHGVFMIPLPLFLLWFD